MTKFNKSISPLHHLRKSYGRSPVRHTAQEHCLELRPDRWTNSNCISRSTPNFTKAITLSSSICNSTHNHAHVQSYLEAFSHISISSSHTDLSVGAVTCFCRFLLHRRWTAFAITKIFQRHTRSSSAQASRLHGPSSVPEHITKRAKNYFKN